MTCELPERHEYAYPEPCPHELQLCLQSAWGEYQDKRLICALQQNKTCEQRQACEAQAWSEYLTQRELCITAHGGN